LTNTVLVQGSPGERISAATAAFAPASLQVVSRDIQARRVALAKQLGTFPSDGSKANQVLHVAGFPNVKGDQANAVLQDCIVEAQSEEAVKHLEDAFNKIK